MSEEQTYKLKAQDFIPIWGLISYESRVRKDSKDDSNPSDLKRYGFLCFLNFSYVIALGLGIEGLEKIVG